MTKEKTAPTFNAWLCDLRPGKHVRERVGVAVMAVTVYLPDERTYAAMKPLVITHGKTAIEFTGAEIPLDDATVRRLCRRLETARYSLADYIHRLAANA
jgi:hypothetical protein